VDALLVQAVTRRAAIRAARAAGLAAMSVKRDTELSLTCLAVFLLPGSHKTNLKHLQLFASRAKGYILGLVRQSLPGLPEQHRIINMTSYLLKLFPHLSII
jgi:hypothetical protein